MKNETLLPLGAGIGIGALGLWALIELYPFLIIGGAGYLVFKGLQKENPQEEKHNGS